MTGRSDPPGGRAGPALLTALADLVLPTPCAGCGTPTARWCAACRGRFARPTVRAVPGLPPVVVLARYAGAARETVLAYKERGRRDLADPLAAVVAQDLADLAVPARGLLVPAPSRRSAARARGGDHMVRLARAVARRAGPDGPRAVRALGLRAGARDSVGLDAAARARNLDRHLRLRPGALRALGALPDPPRGPVPVLLLDDVLTTGATARACSRMLESAGLGVTAVVVLTAVTGVHP